MVRGLSKFAEYFEGYEGNYILIGGGASHLIEEENLFVPRATRDLDIILVIEALTDSFVSRFWNFVREGGYRQRQKSSGKTELYRFLSPKNQEFPVQIELLARRPDIVKVPEGFVLTPIPTGEEISSLSAIILDDEYYNYTIANSYILQGVHIAMPQALICLKANAYCNLLQSRNNGESIDSGTIAKHRNDIIRLAVTIPPSARFEVPASIRQDLVTFLSLVGEDLPQDTLMKAIGAQHMNVVDVLEHVRKVFSL